MAKKRPDFSMVPSMVKGAALSVAGKTRKEIGEALGLNERDVQTILSRDEVRKMVEEGSRIVAQQTFGVVAKYHRDIINHALADMEQAQAARGHGNHRMARRILSEASSYLRIADTAAQRLGQAISMLPQGTQTTFIQKNMLQINANQIISPGIAGLLTLIASARGNQAVDVGEIEVKKESDAVDVDDINSRRCTED